MAGSSVRIFALPGADFTCPKELLYVGGGEELLTVPAPAFLIEHPRGLVLFDTGSHPKVAEDPVAWWGAGATLFRLRMRREDAVDYQLRGLGYQLEDVKYVVISHLHMDHTGGMYMFPNAKFFIGAGELPNAYWPKQYVRSVFCLNDLLPTRGFDWVELDRDTDLFGDGKLRMLVTPGHTPGNSALVVDLPNRPVILAGDTVQINETFDALAPMPLDHDTAAAVQSVVRLKALRDATDARVWPSHDPVCWAEFPHGPTPVE
ncbi:MAG TPA: N-acyl homoserine lactonase family protein [Candidatus Binatia bacterium]|jgi:glyoxylase-like metal-dependent hydrolase (beta-lactamase superfamily II)|nr:N-acyl homoserine lactonase family protein [Candidatus Binatia bacterium]